MGYIRLGTADTATPRLCIGGMSFGEAFLDLRQRVIGQETTQAVIARTLELGVNFIDTVSTYSHGTSEEFIGTSLKNLGVRRKDVVLASKIYFNEGHPLCGATEREVNDTSKCLGTDYLDLYVIHCLDYATPVEETLKALDTLVCSGRMRALRTSSMYAYQLHTMQVTVDAHGWMRFSSMQNHYNLFYREDEREMIPMCCQYDMSLTPYSPLVSGHLTRPTWDSDSVRSTNDATMRGKYDRGRETDMPIIERVVELAQCHRVAMADVALAQLWARGTATSIVGCPRLSRIDDAVRALELTLTGEEIVLLEELHVPHELVGPLARPEDVSQR